jgi:hypothetical protein
MSATTPLLAGTIAPPNSPVTKTRSIALTKISDVVVQALVGLTAVDRNGTPVHAFQCAIM